MSKHHSYFGFTISPTRGAVPAADVRGRWYITDHHHTGVALDPPLCQQYATLDQARAAIREIIAQERAAEVAQ